MSKYIRECDTAMKNKHYFAKCADKERELRLMLRDPKNWLSEFFGREPEMDEVIVLLEGIAERLNKENVEVTTLENFIYELKGE